MKEVKCINQNGRKKTLSVCYSVLLCFFSLCLAFLLPYASAMAWEADAFNVNFNVLGYNNGAYQWRPNDQELHLNDVSVVNAIKAYQWKRNSQNYTGNYATIHFETNIVFPDAGNHSVVLKNLDDLYVRFCGSGGTNGTIKSQSVSAVKTAWVGSTPYSSSDTFNQTVTFYGNVVVTGLPTSGTHDLYCGIYTSNGNPFAYSAWVPGGNTTYFYFEQQPSSVSFTNDETEALLRAQNSILSQVNSSINSGSQDIVNAINDQKESEKQEYQDQSTQNESDINSDTAAQEQQATTLLNAITTVFNTIKDTNASHCYFYLPSKLYGSVTTAINLCPAGYTRFLETTFRASSDFQTVASFPSIKTIFGSVIMVVFLITIALNILHALKKIYNMFLGGN